MTSTSMPIQPPPPGPSKTKTVWATSTSRTAPESAGGTAPTAQALPLRSRVKAVVRELTPPLLYKTAHQWRQRRLASPAGNAQIEPADATTPIGPAPARSKIPERPNLAYRHALALEGRIPELKAFAFRITPANAEAILDFYNSYLPLIREEARGAHQRTLLARLRKAAPDVAEQASQLIAALDLADGLPDRAQRIKADPMLGDELSRQTAAFEQAYGAKVITEKWGTPSRGASLLHYLRHHPDDLVTGKDILHVAPEDELRGWLRDRARRYVVLDGVPDEGTDVGADITAIPLPDASFDFILCHRVLEHVLDDTGAMRELHRILRPGGVLNASVPQAVHREHTAEWMAPDESHDGHVRQYGQDFKQRLESVGFEVRVIDWLCNQPREELLAINALPMRLYEARKIH